MTVDQDCGAVAGPDRGKLGRDCLVIGAVRGIKALFKLRAGDRASPQIAVGLGPGRNDAEAAARARADCAHLRVGDHRGIDFMLAAIAVDRGAWRSGDDRAAALLDRSPNEAVHQRVLEPLERRSAPARQIGKPWWDNHGRCGAPRSGSGACRESVGRAAPGVSGPGRSGLGGWGRSNLSHNRTRLSRLQRIGRLNRFWQKRIERSIVTPCQEFFSPRTTARCASISSAR